MAWCTCLRMRSVLRNTAVPPEVHAHVLECVLDLPVADDVGVAQEGPSAVGLPEEFRFYDLRHTSHALATRSGSTIEGAVVRASQSSEKGALIYWHSDLERQQEVASGLDDLVRAAREHSHDGRAEPSGTDLEKGV